MTETLPRLLLRLSEAGDPAVLWGRQAAPHAGRDFERLLARGVLIEQAPAAEWDVCPACDCGLDGRPVEQIDGRFVAVCPADRRSDLALDAEDLRSFRIDPTVLVREIAVASGVSGEPSLISSGVWHIGLSPNRRVVYLVLSHSALCQDGLLPMLRSVAQSSPISILAPQLSAGDQAKFAGAGLHVAPTADFLVPNDGGHSFALQLDKLTPMTNIEPVLILRRARQSIMLDGCEATLPQRPFDLLWLLAEAIVGGGGIVTRRQIEQRLWGQQVVSKTAAADAVRDLREQLAGSDGRPNRSDLVETRQGKGYVLTLPADAIQMSA